MARTGGMAGNGSATCSWPFQPPTPAPPARRAAWHTIQALPNDRLDPLFMAAAYATEEAILNALLAAETMTGRDGLTIPALPHDRLQELLRQYNRLDPNLAAQKINGVIDWQGRPGIPAPPPASPGC